MKPKQTKNIASNFKFFKEDLQTEFCYLDLEDDETDRYWIGDDMEFLSYDQINFDRQSWSGSIKLSKP